MIATALGLPRGAEDGIAGFEATCTRRGSVWFPLFISRRHYGSKERIHESWRDLLLFAFLAGVPGSDVTAFTVCYDNPLHTPEEEVRYDTCLAIPVEHFARIHRALCEPRGGWEVMAIRVERMLRASRTLAVTAERGRDSLRDAYGELEEAYAAHTRRPEGWEVPTYEIYHGIPLLTPPNDLVVEVHVPVP